MAPSGCHEACCSLTRGGPATGRVPDPALVGRVVYKGCESQGAMSAQVAIVCDHCGDIGAVGSGPQELRADLNGWTWRNGLDICPLCRLVNRGRPRDDDGDDDADDDA